MRSKMNKSSIFVRGAVILILLAFFGVAIYMSFMQLLRPKDTPAARSLPQISNPYQEARTMKGSLYERSGKLLMGTAARNADGDLVMPAGQTLLTRENLIFRRFLLETEHPQCWSNVLPEMFGGLDSDLSNILQDIPLNHEDDTNVTLTIDGKVQSEVYDILTEKRPYSSAVVMHSGSAGGIGCGDVLAMASTPSYSYNDFLEGIIPYTAFVTDTEFMNNVDNSHDCVQDYYKQWYRQMEKDNPTEKDESKWKEGREVKKWISETLPNDSLLFTDKEAQRILDHWNETTGSQFSLDDCITVRFMEIYRKVLEFYQTHPENERFPFEFEPEGIGNGECYIPFFKVLLSDGKTVYLRLCYGSSNFIYADCEANGFDPNFSLVNQNLLTSAPGSCFKILLAAMLIDQADPSLQATEGGVDTLRISSKVPDKSQEPPLPTLETAGLTQANLRDALYNSSNNYFAMCAMELSRILNCHESSYQCTVGSINSLSTEEALQSSRLLMEYYQKKFCVNSQWEAYFNIPESKILSCMDTVQVKALPEDKTSCYDRGYGDLWYDVDETGELGQAYFRNAIDLKKMIGDTAYGQGYDRITPVFMASAIGKCVTGSQYMPNILHDAAIEPTVMGEAFENGDRTVSMLRQNLGYVYDKHNPSLYIPDDLCFSMPSLSYYSKTGTASFDKGAPTTQNTYGTFAQKAQYPVQTDRDGNEKYQVIWYVGCVSDGTDSYTIVLRSFFDDNSYSLKYEFLRIVDSLCRNGYLNYE